MIFDERTRQMTTRLAGAELLEAFEESRDERSFSRLYRSHTPKLYALAMRLTAGDVIESEELVQEAWVRAVERLASFNRQSLFSTWLGGILINCHRERARVARRQPLSLDSDAVGRKVLRVAEFPRSRAHAAAVDVERAISKLPDGFREVLVLHDIYGYMHREIGELLGIEDSTARSQLARARRRLRDVLHEDHQQEERHRREEGHD